MYRATQLDLDRPVALKVFDEGYLTRAGALERFRREAIAAGRLEHPRIVPVYDAGDVGGRAYMAMRFIPGDSLAERIARGGPLPANEALAVLSDIGAALDFAHARGTIHRDVKPANILLDTDGTSYLGDFGLVRLDDMPGLTRRGDWLGTAEYVSPEQVEGEQATAASDVYGLAAVAFEALTGRAPFVRREASAVLLAHVREPVPDASPRAARACRWRWTRPSPAGWRRTRRTGSRTPTASSATCGTPSTPPSCGRRWSARPSPGATPGTPRSTASTTRRRRRRASASPRRSATPSGAPAGSAGP